MMIALIGTLIFVVLCFGVVVAVGPPYVPTLTRQIETALDLLDLQPGQTLLELGAGDGRVLVAAARRGLKVVGYELNPLLALIAWLRTRRFRKQVTVVWGSYWQAWPPADGIFTFMLPRYMSRLDRTIVARRTGQLRLATFAFVIPNKKPVRKRHGVFLYDYR